MWTSDWTAESEEILRADIAAGKTTEEIAARLGRSRSSIWNKANRLGLSRPGSELPWTASLEDRLKDYIANGWSSGRIAQEFGKSRSAINKKVHRLGIARPPKPKPPAPAIFERARRETPWTVEATAYLVAKAPFMSASQIGDHLDVSRNAVIGKIHRLGLSKPTIRSVAGPRKPRVRRTTGRIYVMAKAADVRPAPVDGDADKAFGRQVTLLELTEETCRWPIGDVGSPGFGFCGAKPVEGTPYCWGHCGCAYRPNQRSHRGEILQAAE